MAKRPRVFEQQAVEDRLRELGVAEDSISPTISFMRLLIPSLIRDVGEARMAESFERVSREVGLAENAAWARKMLPDVIKWANSCLEDYRHNR